MHPPRRRPWPSSWGRSPRRHRSPWRGSASCPLSCPPSCVSPQTRQSAQGSPGSAGAPTCSRRWKGGAFSSPGHRSLSQPLSNNRTREETSNFQPLQTLDNVSGIASHETHDAIVYYRNTSFRFGCRDLEQTRVGEGQRSRRQMPLKGIRITPPANRFSFSRCHGSRKDPFQDGNKRGPSFLPARAYGIVVSAFVRGS